VCQAIAKYYDVSHHIIAIDRSSFAKSSLTESLPVAKNRTPDQMVTSGIPNTYVPARNTIFLAFAMGHAEIIEAEEIWAGPNALDAGPYPDCRPAFIAAFQNVVNVATKQAVEGKPPQLITPLLYWDKAEIIRCGKALNVPLNMTFSCYDPLPNALPCGQCDACILRFQGFEKVEKDNS
jgi:7-cyano-7-deazaguanine synthase